MGLIDAFRKAEQRGKQAARRGMEQAMVSLDDAERAVRRRMRVYPHHPAKVKPGNTSDARPAEMPVEDSEIEGRKIA